MKISYFNLHNYYLFRITNKFTLPSFPFIHGASKLDLMLRNMMSAAEPRLKGS
jgi:hypothetical protein